MKTCRPSSDVAPLASTRHTSNRHASLFASPLGRFAGSVVLTALSASSAAAQVGMNYCAPTVPNITGSAARISATGTSNLTLNGNRLNLRALSIPEGQFGFFITSRTQALVVNPGGSQGNLCLGGTFGGYVGPGQIQNAGAAGSFELIVDLTRTPEGGGFIQVAAGETWNFQAWYRDTGPAGQPWSNFSDGLEVLFTAGGGTPIPGMVPIPRGTFQMGSNAPNSAPYLNSMSQQPVHQVTISYPFWIGQHEVSQAEYMALMPSNPSSFPGATRPVERVSWHQARSYCAALTALQGGLGNLPAGYEYRLPTEAEWEYTCRAGTTTEFHFGPDLFCHQARIVASNHSNPPAYCGNPSGTVPVGSYVPNAFGLYDMHGNVFEWCLDSYWSYTSASVTDPFVTGGLYQVVRGGSWGHASWQCTSARRQYEAPGLLGITLGFRVVLGPILVP